MNYPVRRLRKHIFSQIKTFCKAGTLGSEQSGYIWRCITYCQKRWQNYFWLYVFHLSWPEFKLTQWPLVLLAWSTICVAICRPMWDGFPLIQWPSVFLALCILSMVWSRSGRDLGQLYSWQWMADWLAAKHFSVGGYQFSVAVGLFVLLLTNADTQSQLQASHEVHWLRPATHPSLSANHGHILASFVLKVQPPCLHFKVFVELHLAWELVEKGWQFWRQGSCLSQPRVRRAPFSLLRQSWRDLCGPRSPLLGTWSCRPWN